MLHGEGLWRLLLFPGGAEVRTWVVDASDGTVHLINPTGAKGSIALHFDPERQHYQCYVDYVEQHLEARYTELGGQMLHPRQSLARWRPVLHGVTTTPRCSEAATCSCPFGLCFSLPEAGCGCFDCCERSPFPHFV